jgi:pyruvate dehydrogenase E1 component alpha subunit
MENEIATAEVLDEIERRVEAETADAVEFAENSPEPAPEELFTDIYADG